MRLHSRATKYNHKKRKNKIAKQSRKINRIKKNSRRKLSKEVRSLRKLKNERKRIKKISEKISSQLKSVDYLAEKTGFLTRQRKILPLGFLVTLAYGLFGSGGKSLNLLVSNMQDWFGIKITAQGLSKKLKQKCSVKFLKQAFMDVLNFQLANSFKNRYADLFKCFSAIKIEDSTSFQLNKKLKKKFRGTGGAASPAAMKLNVCCDVMSNTVTHADISACVKSDQKFANNIEKTMKKGELLIRDLGYFNLMAISKMKELGVYFLSRLQKGISVFLLDSNTSLNLQEFLAKHTKEGKTIDQDMCIGEKKVRVRFIAVAVPEEVRKKRIQRYGTLRKKIPTEEYITWCGYSIFVTNVSKKMLSSELIMACYKIRWQIELFFKSLKQTLSIDVIKTKNANSTTCMIYAKLIAIFTASIVISYASSISEEELSIDKTIKWLNNDNCFGKAVAENDLESLLERLILELFSLCKEKIRKKKSTRDYLEDMINQNIAA
jgi:IS4 transposase